MDIIEATKPTLWDHLDAVQRTIAIGIKIKYSSCVEDLEQAAKIVKDGWQGHYEDWEDFVFERGHLHYPSALDDGFLDLVSLGQHLSTKGYEAFTVNDCTYIVFVPRP